METSFNAFKIPESNFLVFEATVKSCRSGCRPVECPGPSGREQSLGRRRRAAGEDEEEEDKDDVTSSKVELREMFRVYENRENIPSNDASGQLITGTLIDEVCLPTGTHQAIVASLATAFLLLLCTSAWAWIVYKKTRALDMKNR